MQSISQHRLHNQFITKLNDKGVTDIVAQMGAIQAQDLAMSRWAIGLRMEAADNTQIEEVITKS